MPVLPTSPVLGVDPAIQVAAYPSAGLGLALDLNGQLPAAVKATLPGYELAYSEFTASVTANTVAEAAASVVVTSAAVNFDGATTALIEFYCPAIFTGAATNQVGINLWDSVNGAAATDKGRLFDGTLVPTVATNYPCNPARRITPTAGTHTFSARIWSVAAINFVAVAGAGGAGTPLPGFIRIARV